MAIKYQHVKESAEKLIQQYALTVPVQIFQLADLMGIKWRTCTSEELCKLVPKREPAIKKLMQSYNCEDILGYYDAEDNLMLINDDNQPITRKRFTMAHELGHHQLHHTLNHNFFRSVFFRQDIISPRDQQEAEANYFAGYLLMPDSSIEQKLPYTDLMLGGEVTINELAKLFAVSPEAMRIRLKTYKDEHPEIWDKFRMTQKLF